MITAVLLVFLAGFMPFLFFAKAMRPQFGGSFYRVHAAHFKRSAHWDGKKFNNLEETTMDVGLARMPAMLREMQRSRALSKPKKPLLVLPFQAETFLGLAGDLGFSWFGHSAVLLRIAGKNILIDPMLGPDASPIAPFSTKRFSENTLDSIAQLPPIDAVLFTHDHYDHLDLRSCEQLMHKTTNWLVPLGVKRHLVRWGVAAQHITEFDWWEEKTVLGLTITATPARHFSGRGPFDRAKSLWCGWSIKSAEHAVYWSGDGGYGTHFKEVGERLGPFDWAFMECGQYNARWHQIHMYPEEAVQAASDAKARVATPVHWGAFALAMHPWKEPVERFVAEAEKAKHAFYVPKLGEVVRVAEPPAQIKWWESID